MKKMKKIMALVIAVMMCLAMAVPAMAAQSSANTITINNAKVGETYNAFKMLELIVDDTSNPTAYTYTVAADWADFFADTNIAVWGTILEKDATGTYIQAKSGVASETAWSASSDLSAFAENAAKFAEDHNLTPVDTDTPTTTTATLNTTESGYYLITSTLGTRAMIDTTPGNVTINEKNDANTINKTVKEDSNSEYTTNNDVQIGDTVDFKSEVHIVPRSINVKIHDTMDSGLTLNASSIRVYTDAELQHEYSSATIKAGTGDNAPDQGDTFTIVIPDAFAATVTQPQTLYIVYSAEINSAVIVKNDDGVAIVAQKNKTKVQSGNGTNSAEVETTTTTHSFNVFKHAHDSEKNLANAIFEVKKNGTRVNLVKLDDNNYRIVDDTETTTPRSHVKENQEVETINVGTIVRDFVTVASGDIIIWGVDSDSDYSINELQAPKGYNLLNPTNKEVTVSAENSTRIDVENASGTELPSTGGMGTTVLYIIGAILVVGAAVILIARRRTNKED